MDQKLVIDGPRSPRTEDEDLRFYRLTPAGRAVLLSELELLQGVRYTVMLHFVRSYRSSPVQGGREVDSGSGLQFPTPRQRDCDQCAGRAAKSDSDTPASVATSPQRMLPRLMEPKRTVTKTASPRPRTHSGRAS